MQGYSEKEVFLAHEIALLKRATALAERMPTVEDVRCHELARAFAATLGLPPECVQDGFYGFVEHTWLWLEPLDTRRAQMLSARLGFPHILDVYTVGQLPQVRLLATDSSGLPHVGWAYRPDKARTDIDADLVTRLATILWATESTLPTELMSGRPR